MNHLLLITYLTSMKALLTGTALLLVTVLTAQNAGKLHRKAVLVDGHNDVLSASVLGKQDISHRLTKGHSDLDRWQEGGVDVQFFSVFTGPKARNTEGVYKDAMEEIDSLEQIAARNPDRMILAKSYADVKRAIKQKKLAALIGVEGGHMIEDDLNKLDALHQRGMRYLTLTWNNSNSWATSAMDETQKGDSLTHKGLTGFGVQVVKRLNELGILVDLSHTGEQTFYDAIAASSKPVILSHSSVWALCPVFRNVKDEQIKAVAKNGGVICINFYSGFISKAYDERLAQLNKVERPIVQDSLWQVYKDSARVQQEWRQYFRNQVADVQPTINDLVDHIDYIVKLVGDDYVGIGSDYDGISALPKGLEDVTTYPKITEALLERGYSKKSIRKILGGNVLRVMKAGFK